MEYNYYIINITNINPKYQWCCHKWSIVLIIHETLINRHTHCWTQASNWTCIHIFFISCVFVMIFMTMNALGGGLQFFFELQRQLSDKRNNKRICMWKKFIKPPLYSKLIFFLFLIHFECSKKIQLHQLEVYNPLWISKATKLCSKILSFKYSISIYL